VRASTFVLDSGSFIKDVGGRAVQEIRDTRLTLAVRPSDQGMFALTVGERRNGLAVRAAKGPARSFPTNCSTGPPDKLSLGLAATCLR
jgi:hypothetical protein